MRITCYTFGCPRTGNHAWAALFKPVVRETFHIINNADAVTKGGKFLFLYKREGQRVLIHPTGDLLVRPTYTETAVRKSAASLSDHLLTSYTASLAATLGTQFSEKRFLHGRAGVLKLFRQSGKWRAAGALGGRACSFLPRSDSRAH